MRTTDWRVIEPGIPGKKVDVIHGYFSSADDARNWINTTGKKHFPDIAFTIEGKTMARVWGSVE